MNNHIHPIHEGMLPAEAKGELLGQNPKVFWFIGLSGSGKSTLAKALERELHAQKRPVALLDGDNLRSGLNADLGFSPQTAKKTSAAWPKWPSSCNTTASSFWHLLLRHRKCSAKK